MLKDRSNGLRKEDNSMNNDAHNNLENHSDGEREHDTDAKGGKKVNSNCS